jgi:hypothetical protein
MDVLVRSLSVFPVVGIAVQGHDRNDQDLVRSFPEEDPERERFRETAVDVKFNGGVKAGIDTDAIDGVLDTRQESPAEIRLLRLVIRGRLDHLGFGIGMKSDPLHVSAA